MERFVEKLDSGRRLSQRHNLRAPLRVRVRRSEAGEQKAESENLSQRGVFFASNLALSKGATLDLLVEMPGGGHWRAAGAVAVHRAHRAGCAAQVSERADRGRRAIRLL
jgi:hypothetical protein